MPINAAAASTAPKCSDTASKHQAASVNDMPIASDCGSGRRSVYEPITGCSSEAVSWLTSVISPM